MNSIDDEKCVYLQCTSVCAPKFFDDIVVVGAGDKCLSSNIALLFNHSLVAWKGPSPKKNLREDHYSKLTQPYDYTQYGAITNALITNH